MLRSGKALAGEKIMNQTFVVFQKDGEYREFENYQSAISHARKTGGMLQTHLAGSQAPQKISDSLAGRVTWERPFTLG